MAAPLPLTASASTRGPGRLGRGLAWWLGGYWWMTRWQLASLRIWLPVVIAIEALLGAGFVLGIALFVRRLPASSTLLMCTGIPVICLIMVGILLGPQLIADQKAQGSYDYAGTLPVPRTAAAAAWYTVCVVGGVPGAVIALAVAEVRYGLPLSVSASIVPAILLTAFTGSMLGYALGHAIGNPMITRLLNQVLIFAIFGFTPVAIPASRFPGWLDSVNSWLPFGHMATIVRAGLTASSAGLVSSYVIVTAWGVAGALIASWAVGRRG